MKASHAPFSIVVPDSISVNFPQNINWLLHQEVYEMTGHVTSQHGLSKTKQLMTNIFNNKLH